MVDKAIILAGGRGTRFLPYTKSHPKEMLAVIDKPALQLLVEEVSQSNVKQVLIVISAEKQDVVDFFTPNSKLTQFLQSKGQTQLVNQLEALTHLADLSFVTQPTPNGTGEALLLAKQWVGANNFAVLCGDDVIFAKTPVTKQLVDCFDRVKTNAVVGVQQVDDSQIGKYASTNVSLVDGNLYKVHDIVEKPLPHQVTSLFAPLGRYVFTPTVFDVLANLPFVGGEKGLTDAIRLLARDGSVHALNFDGVRFDFGDKLGYLKGVTYAGLTDSRFSNQYKLFLQNLLKNI